MADSVKIEVPIGEIEAFCRKFGVDEFALFGSVLREDFAADSDIDVIKRVNDTGNEFWSSRDFARVLGYANYRNFEQVIGKAKVACFNSGQRLDDHFVDIDEMIESKNRKQIDHSDAD